MPDPEPAVDKWDITRCSLQELIKGFDYDIKRLEREIDNRRNRIEQIQEHKGRLETVLYKLEKSNAPDPEPAPAARRVDMKAIAERSGIDLGKVGENVVDGTEWNWPEEEGFHPMPEVIKVSLHTTGRLAKEHGACRDGYKKMRLFLPDWKLDRKIPLTMILESNGIADALWTLRAVLPEEEIDRDRVARLIAADSAEHVLGIWEKQRPGDDRPAMAIEIARRFALGEATKEELAAAGYAARDAACAAAAYAAGYAAGDAEREWQKSVFLRYVKED